MCFQDLIKELKGELSGGLCKLATGLCLSSADFDATMVKKAIRVSFLTSATLKMCEAILHHVFPRTVHQVLL